MSQEGLVSSNHYVVRIYPLALPPVSLFPPPLPFISLPLLFEYWLPYNSTTSPLFQPPQINASSLLTLPWDPFVCQLIHFYFLPSHPLARSPSCLLPQIASTGLPLKYSLGQAESVPTVSFPSGMCSSLKL